MVCIQRCPSAAWICCLLVVSFSSAITPAWGRSGRLWLDQSLADKEHMMFFRTLDMWNE